MTPKRITGSDFEALLARLPGALDLEATARTSGALKRRRGVGSATSLLRLALGYAVCGMSLRNAAAWAEIGEIAKVSDVALLNRLRKAAVWLGQIVGSILAARMGPAGSQRRWRLVDATTLSCPGSRSTDWRVHVSCTLGPQPRIEQVELTDGRGSESLSRFTYGPGDIAVGDRGLAKAGDLARHRACGADVIVRTGWNCVRLRQLDGRSFDLFAALDAIPHEGVGDLPVAVALDRANTQLVPMRLIVKRLSAAEAKRCRQRAQRKSRKQGKALQPQTLQAAGYVLILTSLDVAQFAAEDILAIYRLRWQIELLFKRLKSLLHLDELPAKDPDLVRCWIYAKLIAALLLEEVAGPFLDSPPSRARAAAAFPLAPPALAA
jgi:hypothetical protein